MLDVNFARGVFLGVIALAFGWKSLQYDIGDVARAGPGLFPLAVSTLLFLLAAATVLRSRTVSSAPVAFRFRSIVCVIAGLLAFVALTRALDMLAGIVALVFLASLAGAEFRWGRNLQISAGLIAIAYALQVFLGLNLGLF